MEHTGLKIALAQLNPTIGDLEGGFDASRVDFPRVLPFVRLLLLGVLSDVPVSISTISAGASLSVFDIVGSYTLSVGHKDARRRCAAVKRNPNWM